MFGRSLVVYADASGRTRQAGAVAVRPISTESTTSGTLKGREWQGVRHEVEVRPDGYVWQGQKHASLSKVARLITGVRWNGPRFFGLREGASA